MSEKLEALLEAAQAAERPSAGVVDGSWAQIDQRIQAGAGPSVPVDMRGLPGFAKASLPLMAKIALIALIATIAGGVAVGVMQAGERGPARVLRNASVGRITMPEPEPEPEPAPSPAPKAEEPEPAPPPVAVPSTVVPVTPEPAPPSRPRPPRKAKPAPAPAPSRLAEETALLRKAWRALDRGRSVQAATVIATHQREFPEGSLVEEREAVRAVLGCQRDAGAAKDIAERFGKRFPKSVHRAQVRQACEEEKE